MEFTLRPWTMNDLQSLVKYANNHKIAENMTNQFPHPYKEENGKAFIEFATKDSPIHIFAIEVNGEAVGGVGIHPQSDIHIKNAELGYWLAEPFWGKGIVSKIIPQIVDFAFKTYDITRVFARPYGRNRGSQKVLEKNGFKLEARLEKTIFKNGEYEDELIYAIRK
ncbi:GNAT family N-acetyltransferase [Sphingobacteriaceae bacterium]|nr:GNAT family N-acetyltransferase [Sphingobacteriaceae bacterium]